MVREFHAWEGTTSLDVETAELIDGLGPVFRLQYQRRYDNDKPKYSHSIISFIR